MAIILKQETNDYALHPEGGPYQAVVSEVRLLEDVETAFGIKNKVLLIFQTSELTKNHDESVTDDRPMTVASSVNATLSEKGRLMTFLSQQVPASELKELLASGEVDVEGRLKGTQWMLSVEHNEANGRTYANITNAMKAPPEQQISIWDDEGGL